MKLLLDSCVWAPARDEIQTAGHEVAVVSDWGADPGDEAILARAREEGRILVTLDSDFGNLAIFRRLPHAGIVRLVGIHPRQQAAICVRVLSQYGEQLLEGAIVTADPARVRVRPARP